MDINALAASVSFLAGYGLRSYVQYRFDKRQSEANNQPNDTKLQAFRTRNGSVELFIKGSWYKLKYGKWVAESGELAPSILSGDMHAIAGRLNYLRNNDTSEFIKLFKEYK